MVATSKFGTITPLRMLRDRTVENMELSNAHGKWGVELNMLAQLFLRILRILTFYLGVPLSLASPPLSKTAKFTHRTPV